MWITYFKNFNYFSQFLNLIETDKLRISIGDAIFQESKHSPSLVAFIQKYAYFPDINMVNYQDKAEEARKLAYAYCQPYEFNGVMQPAPMKFVFIADINKRVPTNDVFAIAQATTEGRCFITGNGQDFIFNKRNNNENIHDRSKGIVQINIIKGYGSLDKNGYLIVPKPISITTFGAMIKHGANKIFVPEPIGEVIKADKIIKNIKQIDESPITIDF